MHTPSRALIAMSGGVDSSVAALRMQQMGCECVGVTMKLYDNEQIGLDKGHTCCSLDDVEDARQVCYTMGIPHYVIGLKDCFSEKVIDRFVRSYERGETPNPCIDCNRFLKFDSLYSRMEILDCQIFVTGHYARVEYDPVRERWLLKKARNKAKDQSYVLYFMTQELLAHACFPLGEYEDKEEIRRIAAGSGFVNARKHDSQDICFVPDGDYAAFIERRTGKKWPEGDFTDQQGHVLGRHKGQIRYTIGQRRGLGLSLPAPLYVCGKDPEKNTVILSPEEKLFSRELVAEDFNWIAYEAPAGPVHVCARPRYRAKEAPATAEVLEDGRVRVVFDEPQRAITPGQAVVLYDGDLVVGGGTICPDNSVKKGNCEGACD
ncbi:MAG: tRNA 2-thiouridine(34) synthase MnmA [Blautia sp.]|nr:tRNA 2-thiouridine(34) synthase MnmA [Blautia sp.]